MAVSLLALRTGPALLPRNIIFLLLVLISVTGLCSLFIKEIACPQSCSLVATVELSPVYTAVTLGQVLVLSVLLRYVFSIGQGKSVSTELFPSSDRLETCCNVVDVFRRYLNLLLSKCKRKIVLVCIHAPRHEDADAVYLNPNLRLDSVISLTPRPLCLPAKKPPCCTGWAPPTGRKVCKKRNSLTLPGIEPRILRYTGSSPARTSQETLSS
jgi:hypothetical protein